MGSANNINIHYVFPLQSHWSRRDRCSSVSHRDNYETWIVGLCLRFHDRLQRWKCNYTSVFKAFSRGNKCLFTYARELLKIKYCRMKVDYDIKETVNGNPTHFNAIFVETNGSNTYLHFILRGKVSKSRRNTLFRMKMNLIDLAVISPVFKFIFHLSKSLCNSEIEWQLTLRKAFHTSVIEKWLVVHFQDLIEVLPIKHAKTFCASFPVKPIYQMHRCYFVQSLITVHCKPSLETFLFSGKLFT